MNSTESSLERKKRLETEVSMIIYRERHPQSPKLWPDLDSQTQASLLKSARRVISKAFIFYSMSDKASDVKTTFDKSVESTRLTGHDLPRGILFAYVDEPDTAYIKGKDNLVARIPDGAMVTGRTGAAVIAYPFAEYTMGEPITLTQELRDLRTMRAATTEEIRPTGSRIG